MHSLLRPPATRPLVAANHALGDRAAMDAIWDEQGYWFLRGVLDQEAVAALRGIYMDELKRRGVVDPDAIDPIWNGADLTNFPVKMETLHARRIWQNFVSRPAINRFFEDLLGGPVFWVPIVEYRLHAPLAAELADPWVSRHQDGFSNEGIDFRTVWIPADAATAQTGGLALCPDERHRGWLHDVENPPQYPIPRDRIPDAAWRFSDYAPGDVVLFGPTIPHGGMPNYSDRFRLSLDIRVMRADADVPVVGTVRLFSPDRIVIDEDRGVTTSLAIDGDSYLRGHGGKRLTIPELQALLPVGSLAMASRKGDRATVIRPQR